MTRLAVTDLETRDKLLHVRIRRHHARFSDGSWMRRRQTFLLIDRCERRHASSPLPRAIRGRPGGAGWWPAAAPFACGASPEPCEFVLGGARHRIAIGFSSLEHMPREGHELAGGRDDRDVPIFAALEFADEGPQGAGVPVQMLGGLDEQPAHMTGALFGDVAGVTVLSRSTDRGHEAQVRRHPGWRGKPADLTDGGEQGRGHGDIDTRQREQEADAGVGSRRFNQPLLQRGEFLGDGRKEAAIGIDGGAARLRGVPPSPTRPGLHAKRDRRQDRAATDDAAHYGGDS